MAKSRTQLVRTGPGPGELAQVQLPAVDDAPLTPDERVGYVAGADEATESEDEISRVLSELGEDVSQAKVQIWRVMKDTRKPVFVDEILPSDFSMKRIADDYGGGIFNVKVFVPRFDDEGIRRGVKLAANPRFEIDGAPKQPQREEKDKTETGNALASTLETGFLKLGELIIASRPREQGMKELLESLVALDSLRNKVQPAPATDPMLMFERAATIMGKLKSAAEGNPVGATSTDLLLEVVRTFAPAIAEGMKKLPVQEVGALPAALPDLHSVPTPAVDPGAMPGNVTPITQAIKTGPEDEMSLIILGYVKLLVRAAVENQPIDSIAQRIAEQTPDELLNPFLDDPNWLNLLASYDDRVRTHQKWFEALRAKVAELTTAPPAA